MVDFLRSNSARLSSRLLGKRQRQEVRPPSVVAGGNAMEMKETVFAKVTKTKEKRKDKACIVCVGSTGAGKSSTLSRVTQQRAQSSAGFERETAECQVRF